MVFFLYLGYKYATAHNDNKLMGSQEPMEPIRFDGYKSFKETHIRLKRALFVHRYRKGGKF